MIMNTNIDGGEMPGGFVPAAPLGCQEGETCAPARGTFPGVPQELVSLDSNVYPMNGETEDPLSHAQVLSSIRAAKRLRLPTSDVLRAVRRQIDED